MEVFLRNLPAHLTDQNLYTQLESFTKTLNIKDWACQKPRRKPFGTITFLDVKDGQRFLQKYGGQRATLLFMGASVMCQQSRNTPDRFLLKSLTKAATERHEASQRPKEIEDGKCVMDVASLSCGYLDFEYGELMYYSQTSWSAVNGSAKFAKRMLVIELEGTPSRTRLEIPYRTVEAMMISPGLITIQLWEVPRMFQIDVAGASMPQEGPPATRLRIAGGFDYGNLGRAAALGQTLVYRISVSRDDFDTKIRRLKKRDILTIYQDFIAPTLRNASLSDGINAFKKRIGEVYNNYSNIVPFGVIYQAEALIRNGFLLPWAVIDLLNEIVKRHKGRGSDRAVQGCPPSPAAVRKLFNQIPFPSRETHASVFGTEELYRLVQENEQEIRTGPQKDLQLSSHRGLTLIYRVNITPTNMTLHGPDFEGNNRILRRFPDHSDYFLRVQFCDEDGSDLQSSANVSNQDVYQRFKNVFNNGIAIGGRLYKFLGFSHSSLRSHSAWFMATFFYKGELQTYFSIISNLGKFDHIYSPARCAARIGQAFSDTPSALTLADHSIEHIELPEIVSGDGSRVFSDGVGAISPNVMEAMNGALTRRQGSATCFQIRWGGAKGMLSLDPRLEGNLICIRPSMVKFQSSDTANIEICDAGASPIPMVLNRQMIKILEDMGISDYWFLKEQKRALTSVQRVTENVASTAKFMKRQNIGHGLGFPNFLKHLAKYGIDYRKDHFLASIVEAAVLCELRLLKHKARIPIHHGVTLFGVIDETAYLGEGEIYVAFDDVTHVQDHSADLDNRRMIVTRSPALHPGDIQIVTNIVPPYHHPLRSLRNCIVFSQHGERDLPSSLSGGDLDGDTYNIIWDTEAVNQCQRVFSPADYPRVAPLNIGRPVQQQDMTDFFIKFMETDQLGLIAVRHMILADQREAGTSDPDCMKLAEMHSTGVDYSKTGIPVDMSLFRKMKMSRYRPDFLAPAPPTKIHDRNEISFEPEEEVRENEDEDDNTGPVHKYYESDRINGKLFRAIDEKRVWAHDIRIPKADTADFWDGVLRALGYQCSGILRGKMTSTAALQEARQLRSAYEDAIRNLAMDYSDHATMTITELEVFTGTVFNRSGSQTRRQRDRSVRLKDDFNGVAQWFEGAIRQRHGGDSQEIDEGQKAEKIKEALFSSINCLKVGCARQETGWGRIKEEFHSFKVIAACCVIKELEAWGRLDVVRESFVGDNSSKLVYRTKPARDK